MRICGSKVGHRGFRSCFVACSEHISAKLALKLSSSHSRKSVWKCQPFCFGLNVFMMNYTKCMNSVQYHYRDVIMSTMASQITSVSIVYSTVCTGPDQRKHQRSVSLAFVRGIHQWPVNSLHKGPVTRKIFPYDDVIMSYNIPALTWPHLVPTSHASTSDVINVCLLATVMTKIL